MNCLPNGAARCKALSRRSRAIPPLRQHKRFGEGEGAAGEGVLESGVEALRATGESRFGELDLTQQIKETVAKATGWTVGSLSGMGDHSDAKMLRDQYLFLNGVSVGYSMLYTTEVGAHGESDYAKELLKHLRQWNALVIDFNRTLPTEVLRSLAADESGIEKERAMSITRKLQETWSSDPES